MYSNDERKIFSQKNTQTKANDRSAYLVNKICIKKAVDFIARK